MKLFDIAASGASFLASRVDIEEKKVDSIRFGLEVILGEVIKWTILLSAAAFVGIFYEAIFAMISVAIFRMVSGGAHCEDYWRCLIFGMLIFLGGGKVGVYVAPFTTVGFLSAIILVCSLIAAIIFVAVGPRDVPNRKISSQEKTLFKKLSLACLVVWLVVMIYYIIPNFMSVAIAGGISFMVQVLSLTNYGYKSINMFDYILSKLIGERRCSHA